MNSLVTPSSSLYVYRQSACLVWLNLYPDPKHEVLIPAQSATTEEVLNNCLIFILKSIMNLGVLFRKFTYNVVLHLYTMCKIWFRFQIIIQLKEATKTLVSKTVQYPPRCISCLSLAHVAKIAVSSFIGIQKYTLLVYKNTLY